MIRYYNLVNKPEFWLLNCLARFPLPISPLLMGPVFPKHRLTKKKSLRIQITVKRETMARVLNRAKKAKVLRVR